MPINNNNQNNNNGTQNVPNTGDILSQLAANNASTKDLYVLGRTMQTSLSKIEHNQATTNSTLSNISNELKNEHKVLSSVDTKLQQIVSKLSGNATSNNNNNNFNNNSPTDLQNILSSVNNCSTSLDDIKTAVQNIENQITNTANNNPNQNPTNPSTAPNNNTVDLSKIESALSSIQQTSADILSVINQNSASPSSNNNNTTNNPNGSLSTGTLSSITALQERNTYLQIARSAMEQGLNIRDALASEIKQQNPTIDQQHLENKLTELLRSVTTPLNTSVRNEGELQQVILRLHDRVHRGWMTQAEADRLQLEAVNNLTTTLLSQEEQRQIPFSRVVRDDTIDNLTKTLPDMIKNAGSGKSIMSDVISVGGGAFGDAIGGAIKKALPGVVGTFLGEYVNKVIDGVFRSVGDYLGYITSKAQTVRDELIKKSFEKIRKDVTDMATYGIDIQKTSLDKIYNAWDQNLSTVNATQGYTKEALNSLQDAVAQRLQREGYSTAINAADFSTQLVNTLNAKLGGPLAEAFATQNLILQKAVPELDLSGMAAEFAAIYTNAEKQGTSGETAMINAMNQIAGATKALEQVTGGNNQFITQVGSFLKKAEEVVNRSDGTADQIASLTTQMMVAEAPLAALVPQLGGFTNTMVDTLMKGNDATAVALRAIMHDINENVGVSATTFMESFVSDTQGTLATAYQAIDRFISQNENSGARQEFLLALQDVFGLQADQVAQIDFAQIADEITKANTQTNIQALTAAENLLRSGETTTWEDQLVNNTTNQLLATNAVRDTIDNKLMRKLEQNELELERAVYELQATQTVDFADKTLTFFTNIFDIFQRLIDPLGLFDGITAIADTISSDSDARANYNATFTASQIGSTVTSAMDELSADMRTQINGWGMAHDLAVQALTTKSSESAELQVAMLGIADTYPELMREHKNAVVSSTNAASDRSLEMATAALESQQQQANQQQQLLAQSEAQFANIQAQQAAEEAARKQQQQSAENQKELDNKKLAAAQQQRALLEAERAMTTANHDNIEAIRDSVSKLDELSNYLSPILDENRNQSGLLQTLSEKFDQLLQAVTTKVTQPAVVSPTPNVNTSYNEHNRIYGPIKTW